MQDHDLINVTYTEITLLGITNSVPLKLFLRYDGYFFLEKKDYPLVIKNQQVTLSNFTSFFPNDKMYSGWINSVDHNADQHSEI